LLFLFLFLLFLSLLFASLLAVVMSSSNPGSLGNPCRTAEGSSPGSPVLLLLLLPARSPLFLFLSSDRWETIPKLYYCHRLYTRPSNTRQRRCLSFLPSRRRSQAPRPRDTLAGLGSLAPASQLVRYLTKTLFGSSKRGG
jgi:hypothetical protein